MRKLLILLALLGLTTGARAATYTQVLTGNFSATLSGQAANIRVIVSDSAGTIQIAATNAPNGNAITESTDAAGAATTGIYVTRATIDTAWLPIYVKFTIVGQSGVLASAIVGSERAAALADGYSATLATNSAATNTRIATGIPNATAGAAGGLALVGSNVGTATSVSGSVGSVAGDVSGKVLGNSASAFVANGVQVSATVAGNVTVGGYAAGQDPATLVFGAAAVTFNGANTMGAKLNTAGGYSILTAAQIQSYLDANSTKLAFLTGDAFARLGTPAGASIAADIATRSTFTAPADYLSIGERNQLTAAGSAGDPWTTLLTAETTAGSFGTFLKTALPNVAAGAAGGLVKLDAAGRNSVNLLSYTTQAAGGAVAMLINGDGTTTSLLPNAFAFPAGSVSTYAGDPWTTLLTAETTAGSFGTLLKTYTAPPALPTFPANFANLLITGGAVTVGGFGAGVTVPLPTTAPTGYGGTSGVTDTTIQADVTAALNAALPGTPTAGSLFDLLKKVNAAIAVTVRNLPYTQTVTGSGASKVAVTHYYPVSTVITGGVAAAGSVSLYTATTTYDVNGNVVSVSYTSP